MFKLIDQRIYVIVDVKAGFIVSMAYYTRNELWGIYMRTGFEDHTVDDMRKEGCKRCEYRDMYPRCNYSNLINRENRDYDSNQYTKRENRNVRCRRRIKKIKP